jgi:hypothetical protein
VGSDGAITQRDRSIRELMARQVPVKPDVSSGQYKASNSPCRRAVPPARVSWFPGADGKTLLDSATPELKCVDSPEI